MKLSNEQTHAIVEALHHIEKLSVAHTEAITHALADIAESVDKIYTQLLPKLSTNPHDILEEIRDEFRHIQYHIHDAELCDL